MDMLELDAQRQGQSIDQLSRPQVLVHLVNLKKKNVAKDKTKGRAKKELRNEATDTTNAAKHHQYLVRLGKKQLYFKHIKGQNLKLLTIPETKSYACESHNHTCGNLAVTKLGNNNYRKIQLITFKKKSKIVMQYIYKNHNTKSKIEVLQTKNKF